MNYERLFAVKPCLSTEKRDAQALIYDHACDLSGVTWTRKKSCILYQAPRGRTVTQVQGNSLLACFLGILDRCYRYAAGCLIKDSHYDYIIAGNYFPKLCGSCSSFCLPTTDFTDTGNDTATLTVYVELLKI